MAERFYVNSPLALGPTTLEGPEAHHLATVCRLRPGDAVCLFNGDGHEYAARILQIAKRSVQLDVESVAAPIRELPFLLEVAAPLPKGDRGQFLVEKLTELGATAFTPLDCERSVIHPGQGKLEKLERCVIEASKQCGRNRLMEIAAPTQWQEYAKPRGEERRWIGHPGGTPLTVRMVSDVALRLVVGPEGGFTADEIALGIANDWQPIDLGPRILRIETAALAMVAAAEFAMLAGD